MTVQQDEKKDMNVVLPLEIDQRELDIQKVCNAVLDLDVENTGDYGMGGRCPFCYKQCSWSAENLREIKHRTIEDVKEFISTLEKFI